VPRLWAGCSLYHRNDAFTTKLTTQTSLAFEKASIIHLLSAILSSLAASNSRSDPEGLKRAYYNSRASAGMLTYINENFLHAPSTDLSREVVHLLIGVMMAQATEIFTQKLIDEKKSPGLVCRSANQAAGMYAALVDEMREFQGKGVFDRNWLYILQIKAKLFASLAQYYRSVADSGSGKHGAAQVRMKMAETMDNGRRTASPIPSSHQQHQACRATRVRVCLRSQRRMRRSARKPRCSRQRTTI